MRNWRWVSVFAVLILVLAACGQQPGASEEESEAPPPTGSEAPAPSEDGGAAGEPQQGGTLVFAGARLAASLDPALTSDGESFRVLQQVYEPLVDLAPGSANELVGVLAESWEGEPSDSTYVFHLREGVTFHDGTPLNAEAVKINFDRWQNFAEEFQADAYYYGAVMDGFGAENLIESVEATDELTVTFTLRDPSPTFLFGLALTPFAIVSPAILEQTNADDPATSTFGTEVVQGGTGPFVLEDYVPDDSAVLVRNEEYWGDPAYLDRVIIRPIEDPAARLQALQGGSIQGYDLVSPTDYEAVEGEEGLQLVERLSFNSLYLGLNPVAEEGSVLTDLAVRQAIAMAIDKEALIEAFYGGRGSPAEIFLPPSSGWFEGVRAGVDDESTYPYDPDAARALLEEAGFGADNPPTVHFWAPTGVTRPYMPDPQGLQQAVTTMLEDVGFTVEPDSSDWSTEYTSAAQNGNYELHFLGWTGDYDDPSNWYGVHFGYSQGEPAAQFGCDAEGLEAAIDEANATLDEAERAAAWGEAANIIHGEVCFVTLAHGDTALAFTDAVQGYVPNPTGSETFTSVWLTDGGE
ncbi:MAG TPA: ABC transporter substrate-binding protein [Candidatus Limnocylindria bacterium]|nr:ABC transporter substrate-binding protein [Candidatus Limnocylindria bacterium]